MSTASAFIHQGFWPFARIAELATAHDISRSFKLMEPGEASLVIAKPPASKPAFIRNYVASTPGIASPHEFDIEIHPGRDRLLIVAVMFWQGSGQTVNHVLFGSEELTRLSIGETPSDRRVEVWYLLDPAVGEDTVSVQRAGGDADIGAVGIAFADALQEEPIASSAVDASAAVAQSIRALVNDVIIDAVVADGSSVTATVGANQTEIANVDQGDQRGMVSTEPGNAKVNMTWTLSGSADWAQIIVRVRGAPDRDLSDALKLGNLLVITSPVAPTWAGPITVISDDIEGASKRIEAQGWPAILQVRATPLGEVWSQGASGAVFASIVNGINARGHTGLFLDADFEPGPAIAGLTLGGQDAATALADLFSRTGYEWWVDYDASPARVIATIHWGYRQGLDRSADLQLIEGRDLIKLDYMLDVSKLRQSVTVIGGRGAVSSRTAVTVAAGTAPGSSILGSALEATDAQLAEGLDVPPLLRSETVMLRLGSSDRATLSREALAALERPAAGAEKLVATVNSVQSWRDFGVGDYVEIVSRPAIRRARIIGVQPDEEEGTCDLVLEVPIR